MSLISDVALRVQLPELSLLCTVHVVLRATFSRSRIPTAVPIGRSGVNFNMSLAYTLTAVWRCLRQFLQSSPGQEPVVSPCGAGSSLSGSFLFGGSGDRSSILAHFLAVGSETPAALAIEAVGSPLLALLRMSPVLSTPIISFLASICR